MKRYKLKFPRRDSSDFKKLLEEIDEMKNRFSKNTDSDISQFEQFKNDFTFIDMTIYQFLLVAKIAKHFEKESIDCFWKKKKISESTGTYEISVLANNLSNTLWIIRMLLAKGSDHQAKVLFRYYIENLDLLIAIVGDGDFFNLYSEIHDNDDVFVDFSYKWYNHTRPKKLKPVLKKIYEKTLKDKQLGLLMNHYKDSNYEWLSLYSHGHNGSLVVGSIVFNEKGEATENEYCAIDYKMNFSLTKIIIHSGIAIKAIFDLLFKHHQILDDLDKDFKKEVVKTYSTYSTIFFNNVHNLYIEDTKEEE